MSGRKWLLLGLLSVQWLLPPDARGAQPPAHIVFCNAGRDRVDLSQVFPDNAVQQSYLNWHIVLSAADTGKYVLRFTSQQAFKMDAFFWDGAQQQWQFTGWQVAPQWESDRLGRRYYSWEKTVSAPRQSSADLALQLYPTSQWPRTLVTGSAWALECGPAAAPPTPPVGTRRPPSGGSECPPGQTLMFGNVCM